MQIADPSGATPLSPEETDDLIPVTITSRADLNEWEQANIQKAEAWAFSRDHKNLVSSEFICTLHKKMFDSVWRWAGQYRRSAKNIGIEWPDIPVEVKKLCDDCNYWIQYQSFASDEIASRFHHRLVTIHPFPNGNGRHSRMMADLIVTSLGYSRFTWGGGPGLAPNDTVRSQYLNALAKADQGNFEPLIRFVRS
ncbi:mobile mystery protein B [Candidatus Neomarinimicrobiota bacterium]